MAVMQSGRTNQRIHFAVVQSVNDWLDNNPDIVQLSFLKERKAAGTIVRESPHDLIFTWRIDAEYVSVHRIKDRSPVVPLIFPQLVFHQLTGIGWYRNWRKCLPEPHVIPHDSDESSGQRTSAVRKDHQADCRQHDPSS